MPDDTSRLEVHRELIPIGRFSEWEQRPYSQLVWTHEAGITHSFVIEVPVDYALGMLIPSINGTTVDLPTFDAALEAIGTSRQEIKRTTSPR